MWWLPVVDFATKIICIHVAEIWSFVQSIENYICHIYYHGWIPPSGQLSPIHLVSHWTILGLPSYELAGRPAVYVYWSILKHVKASWAGLHKAEAFNPLRARFFRGKIKHIFTFHVIPPHWFDTGGWNPFSNKTRTYPAFFIVNIMAAGVLAMQGARASAAMILTKLNRDNSVPTR